MRTIGRRRPVRTSAFIALMLTARIGAAFGLPEPMRDPNDGQLDMSDTLLWHKGVLPVPAIITEPAIGYGFGLALLYFHDAVTA